MTDVRPDLTVFEQVAHPDGKRSSWAERLPLIHERFPETRQPPWADTLDDDFTLERVIRDLLKQDQQEPGRNGKLPNLDLDKGQQSWRELTGQDFTGLPFHEAFRLLAKHRDGSVHSLTLIARKTGISRSKVHRLLEYRAAVDAAHPDPEEPDLDVMRRVAEAYGKKPGYFREYRAQIIAQHLVGVLAANPEFSANVFRKVIGRRT